MEIVLAGLIGMLGAAGTYLLLRRSIVKLLLGSIVLGGAVNLLIFTSAGLVPGKAPIVTLGEERPNPPFADPTAQAMILTAIVISFGILAFAITLVRNDYDDMGTDDLDALREPSVAEEPE